MTDAEIEAVFEKIDRSKEHLDTLQSRVQWFFKEHCGRIYDLVGETNSQRTKYLVRVKMRMPLPLVEWGVIVGDAIHCLRSALDQLVYQHSAAPDDNTAFPICRKRKEWFTKAPAMVYGVPETVIAALDRAQPYHRGQAADAHPLAILSALSNADKHRYIPVMAVVPQQAEWNIVDTTGMASHGEFQLKTGRPLEDDAVIADMRFKPDESGLEPNVNVYGYIGFGVAFGKRDVPGPIAGRPVLEVYSDIGKSITEVMTDIHQAVGEFLRARGFDSP